MRKLQTPAFSSIEIVVVLKRVRSYCPLRGSFWYDL